MKSDLTIKQEKFAQQFILLGNASEAHRRVYKPKASTKAATIGRTAHAVLRSPKVAARIEELKGRMQEKIYREMDTTAEGLVKEIVTVVSEAEDVVAGCYDDAIKIRGLGLKLKGIGMAGVYSNSVPATKSKHEIMGKGGEAIQLDVKHKDTNYDIARKIAFLLSAPQYQQLIKPTMEIKDEEHRSS